MNIKEKINDNWDIDFIQCNDFIFHVENTLEKIYGKKNIGSLKEFNNSIIDPTKMLFDIFTNGYDREEIIRAEVSRQVDKSVTNIIGYFHQNLFGYIEGWNIPKSGFDVINEERKIYAEIKNKHNTMNSNSSQKTYMKLQQQLLFDSDSTCYLVEIIAKKSQDINWKVKVDNISYNNNKLRRISIDKFYELVTGDSYAFKKICEWLPIVIFAVNKEREFEDSTKLILDDLNKIDNNFIGSIYKLSYPSYADFDKLNIRFKELLKEY